MNRRGFLSSVCGCGGVCGLWYLLRPPRRAIEVRFWLSERAARHDGVRERVPSYLEASLSSAYDSVDVSCGGTVAVTTEDGYEVMGSGEWPRRVAGGIVDLNEVDPAEDVNVLVTDGSMIDAPTGAGVPHLASVGGAGHLAAAPPRDAIDDVVPYAFSLRVAQVLVHEVGHALGLRHEHGTIGTDDGATVASPMVSSYAWTGEPDGFQAEETVCGAAYPDGSADGRDRYLAFEYSNCARSALREYRGGLRP